ncbi:MAG: uncharacterized protein K0S15_1359 [Solirubrobacterales bacterium]|nr:uncharacterized protein [Solirubrobacterales bacterium]
MSENFGQDLVKEAAELVSPLAAAAASDWQRRRVLEQLGWDPAALSGMPAGEFEGWLAEVSSAVQGVIGLLSTPPDSFEDLARALGVADDAVKAATNLPPTLRAGTLPGAPPAELLVDDLLTFVTVDYLRRRRPAVYSSAVLLTLIMPSDDEPPSAPIPAEGPPVRLPISRPRLRLDRTSDLLRDPLGTLGLEYFPDGLETAVAADAAAEKLFPRVAALLRDLGLNAVYGIREGDAPDFGPAGNALAARMLTASARIGVPTDVAELGLTVALSPEERGGLGMVVSPWGDLELETEAVGWTLEIGLGAAVEGFAVGKAGLTVPDGVSGTLRLNAEAKREPSTDGSALRVGSMTGTRLEIHDVTLTLAGWFGEGDTDDVEVRADAGGAALVVVPKDGDGFLQQVLPRDGLRSEFDAGIGWSKRKGVFFRGSASLEATLPLNLVIGPLSVQQIRIELRAEEEINAELSATAGLNLGPVRAAVERLGMQATIGFPEDGGNLGPADAQMAFKPPSGAALSIDAGAVTGGGFLFFDPDNEQYAGALHLEFERLTLNAIGLLTTRMPDGSRGFSLLVIVQASGFAPIQLGFGFTLNGVGGLLAINRTVAVDALRTGIRNKALDPILFSPDDPTPRAPQIVSALQTVFPPAADRYAFGPMALIGWGTPTLLTIEIALILELPAPLRLIVLGRLRAALPDPEHAIVSINLDVLGVIDFDRGELSVDASLYDSRVGPFALTGDMAARASWGTTPDFAMALGGFHPAYRPPPGFPELRRLALALSTGSNPRVRMEAYFALTSNTVQVGARLELYVEAAGFSLEGGLGFDTLIQFSPFRLLAEIYAHLALKRGATTLVGLDIHVHLVGPAPWVLWGEASFKLLFISISIPFRATIGRAEEPPALAREDVWGKLREHLLAPASWTAQLPPDGDRMVVLRGEAEAGEVLAHPLGSLAVSQRVVPLERKLDLFGAVPPRDYDSFKIESAVGLELGPKTSDYFAPAQFRRMGDAEKLSSPSFERMISGVHLNPSGPARVGYVQETPLEYEQSVILDVDRPGTVAERYRPDGARVAALAEHGPAGTAEVRDQGRAKFAPEERGPAVAEPDYVVARRDVLEPAGVAGLDGTYTGAMERLRTRPDRDELQVVRREEVASL